MKQWMNAFPARQPKEWNHAWPCSPKHYKSQRKKVWWSSPWKWKPGAQPVLQPTRGEWSALQVAHLWSGLTFSKVWRSILSRTASLPWRIATMPSRQFYTATPWRPTRARDRKKGRFQKSQKTTWLSRWRTFLPVYNWLGPKFFHTEPCQCRSFGWAGTCWRLQRWGFAKWHLQSPR